MHVCIGESTFFSNPVCRGGVCDSAPVQHGEDLPLHDFQDPMSVRPVSWCGPDLVGGGAGSRQGNHCGKWVSSGCSSSSIGSSSGRSSSEVTIQMCISLRPDVPTLMTTGIYLLLYIPWQILLQHLDGSGSGEACGRDHRAYERGRGLGVPAERSSHADVVTYPRREVGDGTLCY